MDLADVVAPVVGYASVRERTEAICKPLAVEDHVPQPIPEVSPPKWHLGHTAWFFEQAVLQPLLAGYAPYDSRFSYIFNSYYEGQGARGLRERRGGLSRPTVKQFLAYRAHVDAGMRKILARPHCFYLLSAPLPQGSVLLRSTRLGRAPLPRFLRCSAASVSSD